MSSFISKVDTNLEAYKLIYDPTRLLHLLFTKYGDIEEDYNNLILNQLLYNKLSHLNLVFKENCNINNINEFLKRRYKKKESLNRIPKLYDYYKNYYFYFCKPFFLNFFSANKMHNYYNKKAKIFYKNNYSCSIEKNEGKKKKRCHSNSLSSMDNDTQNNTIFTKRNKYIIDNNIDSNKCSITLTFDSSENYSKALESKRSKNDSFERMMKYFINEYQVKNKQKKDKKLMHNENNKIYNKEEINDNLYQNKLKNNNKNDESKNQNNLINYNNKIKEKSFSNIKDDNKNNYDLNQKINNNNGLIYKLSINSSELEEGKKNNNILNKQINNNIFDNLKNQLRINEKNIIKINNIDNNNNNYNINEQENTNKKFIFNEKVKNSSRNNNGKQNIFKLNNKLNIKNSLNIINIESRKSPKKEKKFLKFKDFITLKSNKNNIQMNSIKIFKIKNNQNNNNLFEQEKYKTLSKNKGSTESIKSINSNNNYEIKIDSTKFNTIFHSNKKNKSKKRISFLNKFSPIFINNIPTTNVNLNNKFTNYNSESSSPNHNIFLRNELCSKKKSSTSEKLSLLEYIKEEKNIFNKKNMIKLLKNNLSYSNNDNEQNNNFYNMKSFNSEQDLEKRNSNIIISKNFLFKNYTMGKILMSNNSNNSKNKKIMYGMDNLNNFLQISRNKNKKILNTFHGKSIPHSLSHSKSTSKDFGNKNLIKTSSFKTFAFDDKKIYIKNLKLKKNKYNNKGQIEDIIQNSKRSGCRTDIKYFGKNKSIYKSFGINNKNRIFSSININQRTNNNKKIFTIKQNY